MRYTLRLLTLDQLGRAAALICALELEREQAKDQLGGLAFRDSSMGRESGDTQLYGSQGGQTMGTAPELRRCDFPVIARWIHRFRWNSALGVAASSIGIRSA